MANVIHLSDSEFDSQIIKGKKTAVVDFWADWSGPSKVVAPTFERLADERSPTPLFYKMEIDANSSTPAKYGVRCVPTFLLFKNGEVIGQLVGAVTKQQLQNLLDQL